MMIKIEKTTNEYGDSFYAWAYTKGSERFRGLEIASTAEEAKRKLLAKLRNPEIREVISTEEISI